MQGMHTHKLTLASTLSVPLISAPPLSHQSSLPSPCSGSSNSTLLITGDENRLFSPRPKSCLLLSQPIAVVGRVQGPIELEGGGAHAMALRDLLLVGEMSGEESSCWVWESEEEVGR